MDIHAENFFALRIYFEINRAVASGLSQEASVLEYFKALVSRDDVM